MLKSTFYSIAFLLIFFSAASAQSNLQDYLSSDYFEIKPVIAEGLEKSVQESTKKQNLKIDFEEATRLWIQEDREKAFSIFDKIKALSADPEFVDLFIAGLYFKDESYVKSLSTVNQYSQNNL